MLDSNAISVNPASKNNIIRYLDLTHDSCLRRQQVVMDIGQSRSVIVFEVIWITQRNRQSSRLSKSYQHARNLGFSLLIQYC